MMVNDSKEEDFTRLYSELNSENQNYANCVLQTLIFAQNTVKDEKQQVG